MEPFITDRQTLEELNLLGKYRSNSIFSLFNQAVVTSGGEQLLENMLGQPFTVEAPINERKALFYFFQQSDIPFAFENLETELELWATFLDSEQPSGKAASVLGTLKKKILQVAVKDEAYKRSVQGIRLTSKILIELKVYITRLQRQVELQTAAQTGPVPDSFVRQLQQLQQTMAHPGLQPLFAISEKTVLSALQLGQLEYVLKNELESEIKTLLHFIYQTDVYSAVGTLAGRRRYTYATIVPALNKDTSNHTNKGSSVFRVKDLKHPALDKAVGNAVQLDDKANFLFLTGANMAGKSTLMKTVGIALYLAHAGFPVPASHMEFSLMQGLYTSINVPDDIQQGYSHFYAEVLRVKKAASLVSSGKDILVIFDELFKGTNVKDAYEGTLEVSKAFLAYPNCLFIISTHIIEVGAELAAFSQVQTAYMPTEMVDKGTRGGTRPVYSYQLQPGVTVDRQGMMIIENEGILELLK